MGCEQGKASEPVASDPPIAEAHARLPLNAKPHARAAEVTSGDISALQSDDLEQVRCALGALLLHGDNRPEVADAQARLRAERHVPLDWDMRTYCGGKHLEGGVGGRQGSTVVAYHQQPSHVVRAVQSLFDATYRKVYTRDRRGAPIPDRFIVKEVNRVMNDQVWREYVTKREEVRRRRAASRPAVPGGTLTMKHIAEERLTALPGLDPEVNEVWLFHGTTAAAATGIAENDFRLDYSGSNAGTLYGKGIYLAENVSKSDEYGEGPKGAVGEEVEMGYEAPRPPPGPPPPLIRESYLLICRSVLGRVNYSDEKRPDPDALRRSCTDGTYDSVLGDRLKINKTFRETVVYHDDQLYPEYIVKYERVYFHERFAEVYSQMLKRQQCGRFTGPTAEETEVLRSLWNVYAMPHMGKINKWQLLDLLMAIYQPPADEGADLDRTFEEWDTKKDGAIDWDEFLAEMTQRVRDGIESSGPERIAEIFRGMVERRSRGEFTGPDQNEKNVLLMVWYQYARNQRTIDKWQLLELLRAIKQPPENTGEDLDQTFREIDTKNDGVIDLDEFLAEVTQRVQDA
mmetsp:Transcript_54826/g.152974  ORF Transcript_54826/g.152974 Transcript_54826/m.152974 type:complete len:571 (-) Transcript_54826:119-1831(-)